MGDITFSYWFYILLMACFGYCIGTLSHILWEAVNEVANDK